MDIVVPIKLVPDLVEDLEINAEGVDLDRDFLSHRVDEFSDHALEEALQLKEAHGGTVTVLAADGDETDKALFTALAKGADRAVKLTGIEPGVSSHALAKAMCDAIAGRPWRLVLAGVQAVDDRDGQLGVLMAAYLGVPHVSVVSDVRIEGETVILHQEYSGGVRARFEATPPLVLGIQAARETPRYAAVSRVRQIMKDAALEEFGADVAAVTAGSRVRRMFRPESGARAEMLDGSPHDIAARIAALLKAKS